MITRSLPIAVVAAAIGIHPAGAQRPDTVASDTAKRIAPVRIEGRRAAPATVGGASAVVADLDSLPLPASPVLEQALREIPFVLVRQNSRGEAELSVRGSDSRQVAVLVDGVPLTLGWDHRTDPSLVPLAGARSITIVRGLSSVLQGPNVLGGIVELSVAGGDAGSLDAPWRGVLTADHLGGRSASLGGGARFRTGGGPDAGISLRAGIGGRDSPGSALGGGIVDPTGRAGRRGNSDVQSVDGYLAVRGASARGAWTGLTLTGYHTERGVPPELHVADPRYWRYPRQSRVLAILGGGTGRRPTAWGQGALSASVGFQDGGYEVNAFDGPDYRTVVERERGDDRVLTGRITADHGVGRGGRLGAAITVADVAFIERIGTTPAMATQRYRQRLASIGAEAQSPLLGLTQLSAGLVADLADTPETGDKPALAHLGAWGGRVGITRVLASSGARTHLSFSHRARFPSLRELYSGSLGRFDPNPSLQPERLGAIEAGITKSGGPSEWQAVAFHHRLSDAVVRIALPDGRFRRVNQEGVRGTGIELLSAWTFDTIVLEADVVAQRVRVLGGGAPRHAEHQPALRGDAEAMVPLPFDARASVAVRYTGRQYCLHPETGGEISLAGRARGDAAVERGWHIGAARWLRAILAVDNIGDSAIYDQCGLPQPGRTARLTIEVR